MLHRWLLLCLGLVILLPIASPAAPAAAPARPNVLLIAVDDLRPELGCYGAAHVVSPHVDRFAARGLLLARAYCQQAVCNPSRTSLMTGLRPDTIGVTSNHMHFRDRRPDVVTLPQHFRNHGYHAQAIGKIYHGVFPEGASKTPWDSMGDPVSWSAPAIRFGPRYYFTEEGVRQAKQAFLDMYRPSDPGPDDWTGKLVFGPMTEAPEVPDNALYDGKVADAAVDALRRLGARPQPFFLAVGFIKPHTPFVAPRRYYDLYDPAEIALAANPEFPQDAPPLAGHGSHEVRRYTDQPKRGPFSETNERRLKHGYLACISFIDEQIGRLLDELERQQLAENTIVLLFGDHGWHLGEHGLWGKTTNFELDARAPLILSAPGGRGRGTTSRGLVEFVDIYPTLAELAGLPLPDGLEGKSFAPLLDAPEQPWKPSALSQYPRGRTMGYSMRTDRWRYTEWVDRGAGKVVARELYDHRTDPRETVNVAAQPRHAAEVARLAAQLHAAVPASRIEAMQEESAAIATGFEQLEAGPLVDARDTSGRWTAPEGHTTIHTQHARSGQQSLRIAGGAERQVVWTPAASAEPVARLELWFERWTRREPFELRIEALVGDAWRTIHHDRGRAVVGSFKNRLSLPVGPERPTQFRFTCTTPDATGVMLDDVRLVAARPMRILRVTTHQEVAPVLIRNPINRVLDVQIDTEGCLQPIAATEISLSLDGTTDLSDVEHVEMFFAGGDETLTADAAPFGGSQPPSQRLVFRGRQPLAPGANRFFVSVKLHDGANLSHRVDAACLSVRFDGEQAFAMTPEVASPPPALRIGYAVRRGDDDGAKVYRIPGLARTNRGTLVAVYDVRRRGGGDLPGDVDVGMSRSTDGGQSWEPMQVVLDMGDDPQWRYDGVGDPAVLVDRETNTVWVAATWSHGNRSWVGSGPGLSPEQTGQLMMAKSEDDGRTWSLPINITEQVKRPEWCFVLQGPGRGITMRDGTLVFAAQYQDPPERGRLPHSTIIYSRDHGQTWHIGTGAADDTTEAAVAELSPGVLMLNCRYNRQNRRVVMITRDLGATWTEHPTSRTALPEPGACMASLLHVRNEFGPDADDWLLFSNPNVEQRPRRCTTIKASSDSGASWPAGWHTLIDEGASAGYSCLAMVDRQTVGVLFEGSRAHISYLRVPLSELTRIDVALADCFTDHMVLQRDAPIRVWGTAAAGQRVTVELRDATAETRADKQGRWSVTLPPQPASFEPTELVVRGPNTVRCRDVLLGDVWLCAGQSNMEWELANADGGAQAVAAASRPGIRLCDHVGAARGGSGEYTAEHLARLTPERFLSGQWCVCTPETAAPFSAVGYFFGVELREQLDVPIGLIDVAIGGTPTEAWIRRDALAAHPQLAALVEGNWLDNPHTGAWCRQRAQSNLSRAMQVGGKIPGDDLGPNHSFKPTFMWQSAVAPLAPLAVRGVVWYQGESNSLSLPRVRQHRQLLPTLIADWRTQFGREELPFLIVQLPGMGTSGGYQAHHWPEFREGQRRTVEATPHTAMAVTIDVGHPTNVHPTAKRPVGQRLARCALAVAYGRPIAHRGPAFSALTVQDGQATVQFDHTGQRLTTSDGAAPRHFELAGDDRRFHAASAAIEGTTVVLTCPAVPSPRHVRYAWQPYPDPPANLTDAHGLPASPFASEETLP